MGKEQERDNVEGRDVDGNNCASLKDIVEARLDWINLARDGDKWQDLVNMVMNIRGSINVEDLLSC
jgi:hypothetical protein